MDRWMILFASCKGTYWSMESHANWRGPGCRSGCQMWVTMFLKFSVKVKVMNNVNFPERDLLFYIYASLVTFLKWITPPCLSTGIFYSDCYNLIRNFIWIFLLLLPSYIIIPIVQLESEIGVQFYYTRVQSNYF